MLEVVVHFAFPSTSSLYFQTFDNNFVDKLSGEQMRDYLIFAGGFVADFAGDFFDPLLGSFVVEFCVETMLAD